MTLLNIYLKQRKIPVVWESQEHKGTSEAPNNHWNNFITTAENSQDTYHDSKDMISSISVSRCSLLPVMT